MTIEEIKTILSNNGKSEKDVNDIVNKIKAISKFFNIQIDSLSVTAIGGNTIKR